MLLQRGDDLAIVLFGQCAFRWNDERLKASVAGNCDAGRFSVVGDDNRDPGAWDTARIDGVGDGYEVRAASGEKNAERFHDSLWPFVVSRLRNHYSLTAEIPHVEADTWRTMSSNRLGAGSGERPSFNRTQPPSTIPTPPGSH